MSLDWQVTLAARWRPRKERLKPVTAIDPISLTALLGVDTQKAKLISNTERFVAGLPSNNVLLWGSRGTGKSSLVKAVFNQFSDQGLRLIEVDRDDLAALPDIVDDIRELSQRFIVFCDDLSFSGGGDDYRYLKSVMEGSIELPPENVRIYATSNRRHLVPEFMEDNLKSENHGREIHFSDSVEEKISLSDRFGLSLSFYPISERDYFDMVDVLFPDMADRSALHVLARRFSMEKGVRSGRTAKQFFMAYSGKQLSDFII